MTQDLRDITDQELVTRLRRLVRTDQTLTARLVVHLGEMDARGLYREHAYASMFTYCVEELQMSDAEAYLRIQAARLSRRFPLVVQLLSQRALHLTAIKLLGPHLTPDNHVQLLERASGKGKREIELLVAELAPKPDVPNRMRKLPETNATRPAPLNDAPAACDPILEPSLAKPSFATNDAPLDLACNSSPAPFALETPRPRASSKPLSPGRYKLELTASQALHDKLQQLKDLLRHQVPDGDLAVIVERAVDLLIDNTMKQRFAQTRTPKQPRPVRRRHPYNANSRYIPRAVVREVHQRDAGRCTLVSSDGKRCSECGFLELHHHDVPYAKGGKPTTANLRLLCRTHNALLAERDYGRRFMRAKLAQTREPIAQLAPER